MQKDKHIVVPAKVTLIVLLAGTALYGWHLAIHPEPQLDRLIGPVLPRTEDIAPFVAVASRHEDGACQSLVAPEADLHLLREVQADPMAGRVAMSMGVLPVRTFDEMELVNAAVCAHVNYTSGALRILTIVRWAMAAVSALVFQGQYLPGDDASTGGLMYLDASLNFPNCIGWSERHTP